MTATPDTVGATALLDHTGQVVNLVDRGPCPLCGAPASERRIVHDFRFIPVVRCTRCGMMLASRVFDADATARYYAHDWGSDWHRAGQLINARVNVRLLARLLPEVFTTGRDSPAPRVLDVGCGYGYLVAQLRARGIDATGVEVSRGEALHARDTLRVPVINEPLERAGFAPGSFDCVLSAEVIEHTLDPVAFLREQVRVLRPGGWLVVVTDNFESPIVRELGAGFSKWIPHTHVSLFGPETLARAMRSAGITPSRIGSFTTWEVALRAERRKGQPAPDARTAWSLERELREEMNRSTRLAGLRGTINPLLASLSWRTDAEGTLMFLAGQRPV